MATTTGLPTWAYLPLAASALLYRLLWPFIDSSSLSPNPTPPNAIVSLTTKFLFVFSGLSCFLAVFAATALPAPPKSASRAGPPDARAARDQLMYRSAVVLCMAVTTINYGTGWRWGLLAVSELWTRGWGLGDPSLFDRVLLLVCDGGLTVVVGGVCLVQWRRVARCWEVARRTLLCRDGGVDEKLSTMSKLAAVDVPGRDLVS